MATTPSAHPIDLTPTAPIPSAPRVIVGFQSKSSLAPPKPTRSRSKKGKMGGTASAAAEEAAAPVVEEAAVEVEVTDEVEEKKTTSAVTVVEKKIKAAGKKILRIVTYEGQTEALNKDQILAVATKPSLEATVKELQELLVILKVEEVEDEARLTRVKASEEKKQALAVAAAVAAAKVDAENTLITLLQFLHLHGLYTQQGNGFAPAALPSVVANATGNEVAAIRYLHDTLVNGPLLGGHGDAIEALNKIVAASAEDVLPSVTFARVTELIAGLTSPPAIVVVTESSAPATPADSVVVLANGSTESHAAAAPAPSFLQASELETPVEQKVASWADEVEAVDAVPLPIEEAVAAPAPVAAETHSWSAGETSKPLDWASEDQSNELPSLEGLVPAPVPAPAAPRAVESDGFQPARPARRGGAPGAPGGPRGGAGGERGRGGRGGAYRGRGRGGVEGGEPRAPREEGSWTRAPREEGQGGGPRRGGVAGDRPAGAFGEGRGRGGRGRGEGRGRGGERGGPRNGAPNGEAGAPAAAAPAPAAGGDGKW